MRPMRRPPCIARHLFTILSALSLALCVVVGVFCVRAQMGSNDYVELRSKDEPVPERPVDLTWASPKEDWDKFSAEFEKWEHKRWLVHVRANPNAIFAFGGMGYPANNFSIH